MIEATPDFEWHEYFDAADKNGSLHSLFEKLEPHLRPGQIALDLGCGVGRGTVFLLEHGLEVTAVDIYEEALTRLRRRLGDRFSATLIKSDIMDLVLDERSFDVVVATSVLYFLSPADFEVFWPRIVGSIKPGGFFAGQFMGPNDPWSSRTDYNFQSVDSARKLLEGFEVMHFVDQEWDHINTVGKEVHAHQIQVLARKL